MSGAHDTAVVPQLDFPKKRGYNRVVLKDGTRLYAGFIKEELIRLISPHLGGALAQSEHFRDLEQHIEIVMSHASQPRHMRVGTRIRLGRYALRAFQREDGSRFLVHRIKLFPRKIAALTATLEEFRVALLEVLVHEVGHMCYTVLTEGTATKDEQESYADSFSHNGVHIQLYKWLCAVDTKVHS